MFGIGAQEMVIVGLLCLLVFGPAKLSGMARDLGGFVRRARESVDEFKAELEVDGGHEEAAWEDPDEEYPKEAWGDERRDLESTSELKDGAGNAKASPEGSEGAPGWVPAPVTYPDLEEGPRLAQHAGEPMDAKPEGTVLKGGTEVAYEI